MPTRLQASSFVLSLLGTISLLVLFHGFDLVFTCASPDTVNDVVERENGHDRHTGLLSDLTHCARSVGAIVAFALLLALRGSLLLPVERNDDAHQFTTLALDNADGLPDGRTSSHNVVNDNNLLPLHALSHHQASLAMILDFFSVEAEPKISILLLVNASELFRGGGTEGDALVCGTEENVELEVWVRGAVLGNCARVGLADAADRFACAEQAAVQEVGRLTPRLESKIAESENTRREGELDKLLLVRGEVGVGHFDRRVGSLSTKASQILG